MSSSARATRGSRSAGTLRRAGVKVAADTIGIETKALGDAVRGGQSVAEVARANDVEPQAVIDAIVVAATTKIDQAVDDGKIGATRGALKERLAERVERLVDATPGERLPARARSIPRPPARADDARAYARASSRPRPPAA